MNKKTFAAMVFVLILLVPIVSAITVPPEMQDEWDRFTEKYGTNWIVKWNEYTNAVSTLHGSYSLDKNVTTREDAEQIALDFIIDNRYLFKVNVSELKLSSIIEDFNSFDIYYQQYYQGIPVERARVSTVINKGGSIKTVGNGFHPNISISTTPTITEEEAVQIANESFALQFGRGFSGPFGETTLVILPRKENESTAYYFTWKVPTERTIFYVDAIAGKVVGKYLNELPGDIGEIPKRNESEKSETNVSAEEFETNITAPSQTNVTEALELNETPTEEIESNVSITPAPPEDVEDIIELPEPTETPRKTNEFPTTTILPTGKTFFKSKYLLPIAVFAIVFLFILLKVMRKGK